MSPQHASGVSKRKRVRDALENDETHPSAARVCFLPARLPQDIVDQILSPAHMPDPIDLARLKAVSRGMRAAVVATKRKVHALDTKSAAELGCLSTLQHLLDRGRPVKLQVSRYAAKGGQLEVLQWARANDCL
jgi:hypothetical protein|tara:strand:+ start:5265 stop:5663 length:399 start_codon:yes stop_codon:yes gene_type:complete